MRILLIIISLFLSFNFCQSQKEFYNWYFGNNAGITFMPNGTNPVALKDGKLDCFEGCATISDPLGRLLFYTDGITVWNKQHEVMQNGTDLFGGFTQMWNGGSSEQSSLIIANPEKANIFYIFTTDANENSAISKGLCYSIVDLSMDNGNGAITQKNIQLLPNCAEKLSATLHSNGKDFWLMSQVSSEASFYAYLITSDGVLQTPIISKIGMLDVDNQFSNSGAIKFSPMGNKLAHIAWNLGIIELFDFDKSTGILSNLNTIQTKDKHNFYGLEFSPNASKLYVTIYAPKSQIIQFDLNSDNILNYEVIENLPFNPAYALQLGPDLKIYVAKTASHYLGVIHNPDSLGKKCNYEDNGVYLGDASSLLGLPNVVVLSCKMKVNISSTKNVICLNDSAEINVQSEIPAALTYKWNTGENTNKITVKEPGDYSVIVTNYDGCFDSLNITVSQSPTIIAELKSTKLAFCNDEDTMELFVKTNDSEAYTYKWSNGNTSERITIDSAGDYSVIVTNQYDCSDSLSISVIQSPPITAEVFSSKESLCEGDNLDLYLDTDNQKYIYKWNTGETSDRITIDKAGDYSVIITNEYDCTKELKISIYDNKNSFSFALDSIYAKFGENILVNGKIKARYKDTDFILKNINIELAIDAQAFLPNEIAPEAEENYINQQKQRIIKVHFDSLHINSASDIILKIQGLTLLGDSLNYPISVLSFTFDNKEICFDSYDGLLQFDAICEYNIRHLQSFIISNFTTNFNPSFSSDLEVNIQTQEEGDFDLNLYNSLGVQIANKSFTLSGNTVKNKLINLDMSPYAQGLYFLILNSPMATKSQKILYVK